MNTSTFIWPIFMIYIFSLNLSANNNIAVDMISIKARFKDTSEMDNLKGEFIFSQNLINMTHLIKLQVTQDRTEFGVAWYPEATAIVNEQQKKFYHDLLFEEPPGAMLSLRVIPNEGVFLTDLSLKNKQVKKISLRDILMKLAKMHYCAKQDAEPNEGLQILVDLKNLNLVLPDLAVVTIEPLSTIVVIDFRGLDQDSYVYIFKLSQDAYNLLRHIRET